MTAAEIINLSKWVIELSGFLLVSLFCVSEFRSIVALFVKWCFFGLFLKPDPGFPWLQSCCILLINGY